MSTEQAAIFTNGVSEYTNLLSASPTIDFTDWPCLPGTCPSVNGPSTTITSPVATVGYFEIQFMLANNFWGCSMSFGNSACGINVRQGIAHMVDKIIFTSSSNPDCVTVCTPIDNPLPTTIAGGLPAPYPCAWDASFLEPPTPGSCSSPYPGGTAYHIASAVGGPSPWTPGPGTPDLNAAAQHFVNALSTVSGCSTISFNSATSVLNIPAACTSSLTAHVPTFFIRTDDPRRQQLGNSYAEQICYIFTGSYTTPCTYLNTIPISINGFPGFQTNPLAVNLGWWMYTAGYIGGTFFDSSLYYNYNSRFVSASCTSPGTPSCATQVVGGGFCSNSSVQSASAADYLYLCSPSYDSLSATMENDATLLAAQTDGITAENTFGSNAFTIPVYETTDQFGYCTPGPGSACGTWSNVINSSTSGLPNFFTWLNAYNPSPAMLNTIRQGFAEDTRTLNPYEASTAWDFYILGNIYDSLYQPNPLNPQQFINWMTINTFQLPNTSLTYVPPLGTVTNYRFTLIPGLTFQNGRPITSFDVAFSYLSLLGAGAFQSGGASSLTGITILGPHQFDFNLDSNGPFTLADITGLGFMPEEPGLTIMPGQLWTNNVPGWNSGISTCTGPGSSSCYPVQYGLSGSTPTCVLIGCASFPASTMAPDPAKTSPSYDPLANGILVGSSAWQCSPPIGGPNCSSSLSQNPGLGGKFTLSANPNYVRSTTNLALWIWAADGNPTGPDLLTVSFAASCYNAINTPVGTPGSPPRTTAQACSHWQQGIGGPVGTVPSGTLGTALSNDPKLVYIGTTFGAGDSIVYNVVGGTTYQATSIPSVTTNSGSTTVTVASGGFPGVVPEMGITGAGIAAGTTVVSVSGNTLVMSLAATASGTVTLTFGDPIIGCVSTSTCSSPTPTSLIGQTLNSGLTFYDNPALGSPGVWVNGKSVVYDTDASGGYDFGDVSGFVYSNSAGLSITPAAGMHIPPPPPGGCPASATSGCWLNEGSTQYGIVALRYNYNWIYPYNWGTSPPTGIIALPPVLQQPGTTVRLNPDSVAGCTNPFNAGSSSSGGYDC
jgi:hypothetical protein